jgi:serine/threonine-protein kinase PpkA
VPADAAGLNDYAKAEVHREPTGDAVVDATTSQGAKVGAALGYSVALRYLGSLKNATAPTLVRSWIADKDLTQMASDNPQEVDTVSVAVLLTKNQLNTLSSQLRMMVQKAEESIDTQSVDFFQNVLTASAAVAVDPNEYSKNPNATLADLGGLTELLEGLPYTSLIMGLTERDWYNMSAYDQDGFIRTIRSKLQLYDVYDQSQDWAKFSETWEGDWLYRVPLHSLP